MFQAGTLKGVPVFVGGSKRDRSLVEQSLKHFIEGKPAELHDRGGDLVVLTAHFKHSIGKNMVVARRQEQIVTYARMKGGNDRWFPMVEADRPKTYSFTMILKARGDRYQSVSVFSGEECYPSPTDTNIRANGELHRAAVLFWNKHAFVKPDAYLLTPLIEESETTVCPW